MGNRLFKHFVEINLKEDREGDQVFAGVKTTNDLYMRLGNYYSKPLGDKTNTLVFLDEIQSYPHLMTMLKFLNQEGKYRFIASGSQLGVALSETPSVPARAAALARSPSVKYATKKSWLMTPKWRGKMEATRP